MGAPRRDLPDPPAPCRVEHWWDHGPGAEPPKGREINHNLGIYGWDLRDALPGTAGHGAGRLARARWTGGSFRSSATPTRSPRSGCSHSARDANGHGLTPAPGGCRLGCGRRAGGAGDNGDPGDGIETLIVELGANNALGSVISLKVRWSGAGYDKLHDKAKYNVWRPTHSRPSSTKLPRRCARSALGT